MEQIAVIGAGSWGTALAILLCGNGHQVRLWGHDPGHIADLARDRENRAFLPGPRLPDDLHPAAALEQAMAGATAVLVAVPSQFFAGIIAQLSPLLPPHMGIVWATKPEQEFRQTNLCPHLGCRLFVIRKNGDRRL